MPNYWHHAKPILDAKCAGCHAAGGIAPFTLTSYADTIPAAAAMLSAIAGGRMPPWPPNDCCGEYRDNRSLSAAETDTLLRWLEARAPEGDPTGAPPSEPRPPPRLSRVDVTLRMPEPYVPVATDDTSELRCFVIEGWPYEQEMHVTGVDVRPGNPSVVHHVIVQTFGAAEIEILKGRDGQDGRPGFDCRRLTSELHVNGRVGSWTPGGTPVESPDGAIGVPFPARSQVVLQVHYDVRHGVSFPDQTEIDFQVAERVTHRGRGMVVTNPLWLAGDGLEIAAGDPDAVHTFAYDPTVIVTRGRSFFIHTVNLHMHFLGSRGRLAVHRRDGSWDCLLDIPAWDYHWASPYALSQPVEIQPGDMLYVECHWDNSAANQVPVGGVRPPPRDLRWATAEEMCAGVFLYTDTWP
jgi:hypothetical protein